MSSANSESFTSFLIWIPFISLIPFNSLMLSHWGSPLISYMPIQNKKFKKVKKKGGERQE